MAAKGLVKGMTGAFQTTTTDNICLVINSDASGEGMRPSLTLSCVSGLTLSASISFFLAAAVPRWLVTAERLHQLGGINQLTNTGHVLAAAKVLAAQLGEGSEGALKATKRLLGQVTHTSFGDQLEVEADMLATSLGTDESQACFAARLSGEATGKNNRKGG